MKTCPQCGRSYSDAQLACHECGVRLPEGTAAVQETVSHIDFLLTQLTEWTLKGWVTPPQARRLYDEYLRRRTNLLNPQAASVRPSPTPVPPIITPLPLPTPVPERRPGAFAAFLEQSNISYWHIVGAMLLLAGVAGLVRWTWGSVGRLIVFVLMVGLTVGLFALSRSQAIQKHRVTATAFTAISALLVPLDLLAAHAFRLIPVPLSTPLLGLGVSALCLPVYFWLARREPSGAFVVILLLDISAAAHFLLQTLLPGLLHTRDALALLSVYGIVFLPLAFGYLAVARRETRRERRAVWLVAAHATTLAALGLAVAGGGASAFGTTAATLLLAAVFYAGAAWLFEEAYYVSLACALAVLGSVLMLHRTGRDYGGQWYAYALLCQALMLGFWVAGAGWGALGRERLARAYREAMTATAGLALIIQAARLAVALVGFPDSVYGRTELGGALLAAAVSLGWYLRLGPRAVGDGVWAYVACLLGMTLARVTPAGSLWHRQPNWGLWLAVAAVGLRLVGRRRRSTLVLAGLSLLFAIVSALVGNHVATTVLGLLLLLPVLAWEVVCPGETPRLDRQTALVQAMVGATLLVLLGQSCGLPILHTRLGWEANPGYGLFALAALLLALSVWRRLAVRDDSLPLLLIGGAWLLGGADVVLQFAYASAPGFAFSPLALLGLGSLCTAGIGLWRRSSGAAVWSIVLMACVEIVYSAELFEAGSTHNSNRESLTVALLLAAFLAFVFLARQQRRVFLVYAAATVGTLGYVQGLHRGWAPDIALYPLLVLPFVTALYLVGLWLGRRDRALWQTPLHTGALFVSLLALVPIAALFLPSRPADAPRLLEALLGYGVLYTVLAVWERGTPLYLSLAATLWDAAYLFVILRHQPALPQATLGFAFSLAALLWLTPALGASRLKGRGRQLARSLSRIATATALVAVVLAVTGLGGDSDRYAVYTLLVAGTVFLGNVRGLGQFGWHYLGVGTYLLAYFAFLFKRLGAPSLATSDFYLIPVGLYILALGFLSRRRMPAANRQPFYLAGLLLVLTPTFLAARQPESSAWQAPLLATECAGAVFAGITLRIKAFAVGGTAFLVALIASQFQGYLTQIHWAVYATLLGLAIIASALFFENRRDAILRWTQAIQERLRDWE